MAKPEVRDDAKRYHGDMLPLGVDLQDIMASIERVKSGEATEQDYKIVALTREYDVGCGGPE